MSNVGIPQRIIQEISGHNNLEQLQHYLEVKPDQVKGAIASLSMLSYTGKASIPSGNRSAILISLRSQSDRYLRYPCYPC